MGLNPNSLKNTSAYKILSSFFDDGVFSEIDSLLSSKDGYAEAITAFGTVDGVPCYAFAQNSDVSKGAMSKAQSKKITRLYDMAKTTGAPIVAFYDSIGGNLSDGCDILSSYGEVLKKSIELSGIVPQISVVLGTCLGTSALTAVCSDFLIMKKDATLSVDTLGTNADAEYNFKNGVANTICDSDEECIEKAKKFLSYFPSNNLEQSPIYSDFSESTDNGKCMAHFLADEDSTFGFNKGLSKDVGTAFGRIGGMTVGFVTTKGTDIDENATKKIVKMVSFCDAFSIPIVTTLNAKAFTTLEYAKKVACAYAEATTAKISVISSEAYGAAYIALSGACANSDIVFALDNAVVSPISPKAAAYVLDSEKLSVPVSEQEQIANDFVSSKLNAENAAEFGLIDEVVEKSQLRNKVISALNMLVSKRVSTLPKKHNTIY